jgi:hypothetical protein
MTIMKKVAILSIVAGLILFSACDHQSTQTDTMSEDLTIAEMELSALKSVDESTEEEIDAARFAFNFNAKTSNPFSVPRDFFGQHFPDCAEVTVEGESFPKTITIEYGEDCINRRGIAKTGKVIISISDSMKVEGSTYTVSYENVKIGEKSIEFEGTYTYEGLNENENHVVSWTAFSKVTRADSLFVKRERNYSKEWLSGFDTRYISDDQFLLSGNGYTLINDTLEYGRTITDPLYFDRACRFILSGVIELSKGEETMYIDFGDGTCDNIATVTKEGESEEIELIKSKLKNQFDRTKRNMKKKHGWW